MENYKSDSPPKKRIKKVKFKCQTCSKKIKELYVDLHSCKCSGIYCQNHIQNHQCTFDYRAEFIKNTKNILVKIESDKVQKI